MPRIFFVLEAASLSLTRFTGACRETVPGPGAGAFGGEQKAAAATGGAHGDRAGGGIYGKDAAVIAVMGERQLVTRWRQDEGLDCVGEPGRLPMKVTLKLR